MVTQNTPMPGQKIRRPTREELADMVQKLRDAAMNVPNLDSGHPWSESLEALIKEADALLYRRRYGSYMKKTSVNHERIKRLATVFYERVERGDDVRAVAKEHDVNRKTVVNWHAREKKRREEARQS